MLCYMLCYYYFMKEVTPSAEAGINGEWEMYNTPVLYSVIYIVVSFLYTCIIGCYIYKLCIGETAV